MGMMAALAGLILAARLNAATPQAGTSLELDAMASVYFGGASTSGGIGTITGAIVGGLVMGVLNNGMSILGVGVDWQQAIKGLSLLLAVVLDIYNKKSGMLGISGISSDSRDIENALFKNGDERALLTGLLYARIVSKYIGSYFVEMGGVDAIAFTAGVGENASYLRRLIIDNVSRALGVFLNEEENERRSKENRLISHQYSKVDVYVIPTNEEVMIARDTVRILGL